MPPAYGLRAPSAETLIITTPPPQITPLRTVAPAIISNITRHEQLQPAPRLQSAWLRFRAAGEVTAAPAHGEALVIH